MEPNLTKMDDNFLINQKKYLILSIVFVVILFISSSYALLTNFDTADNVVNVSTGNLNMTINNTDSLVNHELSGKYPETDANGFLNASPITLTFTNTGTMDIMKYVVKLMPDSDPSKVSTLSTNCIKYAISLNLADTLEDSIVGNLGSNNSIIFTGYFLKVNSSKTIYLRLWIDGEAGNDAINKTFYGSVNVDLYQKADVPAGEVVKANIKSNNTSSTCQNANLAYTEDGITYISGSSDCIDFNYLWYSGKMWRITAIYPDGAIKLVTSNNITTIGFNASGYVNYYTDSNTKSYAYQWLNEDFYDTLENADNIIDMTKYWNATQPAETIPSSKPAMYDANNQLLSTVIPTSIAKVGLLNSYEYYKNYQNVINYGYLNIRYYGWLLNPNSETEVRRINNVGNDTYSSSPINWYGIRPSIIVKSNVQLTGNGTINNPYKITIDKKTGANQDLVNTRISGEYIKIKYDNVVYDEIYRIVNIEKDPNNSSNNDADKITKIVSLDYVKENNVIKTLAFATANNSGSGALFGSGDTVDNTNKSTWYSYLNGTFTNDTNDSNGWFHSLPYHSLLTEGLYYIRNSTSSYNYKDSVCSTSNTSERISKCISDGNVVSTKKFNVGLLRIGEMFATQEGDINGFSSSADMWLINNFNFSNVSSIQSGANGRNFSPTNTYAVRPTVHLKSTVKILECPSDSICDGTKQHPYIVGLS